MLGGDDGRDQPQEAFQLMAVGKNAETLGAAAEDSRQVGQADGIAVGDLAQRVFAVCGTRCIRCVAAQGLPTS